MLEKPNPEYCAWLRKPSSWGGAIELTVLSQLHSVEIVALNVQTAQPLRFGEGQGFNQCCFVVFDGLHYDPLEMVAGRSAGGASITTFNSNDVRIKKKGTKYART